MGVIKNCPLCDGQCNISMSEQDNYPYETFSVFCNSDKHCGYSTGWFKTEREAMAVHNNRKIEDNLRTELARLREATRWIPVEERLPKDGQEILVWHRMFDGWIKYTYDKKYKTAFIETFSFWRPTIQPPEVE